MSKKPVWILGLCLSLLSPLLTAETPEEKGYRLMQDYERRDVGWGDSQADMEMIIRRGDGREVLRRLRTLSLEGGPGSDKSLLRFDEPKDVRGTQFLTHGRPHGADDQWIFLPSQNRVKRIGASRQTGRFMGSEFTFEDMADFAVDENSYRYLREEACGEHRCHVIEGYPKDPKSGYEKTVFYIDTDALRSWKIDFYSRRNGRHTKTAEMLDYQLYEGRFWRAQRMVMRNLGNGAETEIRWQNMRFNVGLSEQQFRKVALERRL